MVLSPRKTVADDLEFSSGFSVSDENSIRPIFKTLAMLNNRSCVETSIKLNLLPSDRVELQSLLFDHVFSSKEPGSSALLEHLGTH